MRWPPAWPAIVGGGASLAQSVALKESGQAEECQSTFVVLNSRYSGANPGLQVRMMFWVAR